eukprot:SAG31_NODE_1493_length_8110_cov_1.991020_6_plen_327_part_00
MLPLGAELMGLGMAHSSDLAYSNNVLGSQEEGELATGGSQLGGVSATFCFLHSHPALGLSTYDLHKDGSGVAHVSTLRPQLMMRPGEGLWQFPADSHIVSFLHHAGIDHDIITDEHLHADGAASLEYRCVVTGTHPEYFSSRMLRGITEFTHNGGRLAYLGANGFYWHVAFKTENDQSQMEMRRAEDGMRYWIAKEGEYFSQYTGELCGLWRRKGAPPQKTAGVGFTAQGFDGNVGYELLPAASDPRVSFVFDELAERSVGAAFGAGAVRCNCLNHNAMLLASLRLSASETCNTGLTGRAGARQGRHLARNAPSRAAAGGGQQVAA